MGYREANAFANLSRVKLDLELSASRDNACVCHARVGRNWNFQKVGDEDRIEWRTNPTLIASTQHKFSSLAFDCNNRIFAAGKCKHRFIRPAEVVGVVHIISNGSNRTTTIRFYVEIGNRDFILND